jgi:hypothetical protein
MLHIAPNRWCDPLVACDDTRAWGSVNLRKSYLKRKFVLMTQHVVFHTFKDVQFLKHADKSFYWVFFYRSNGICEQHIKENDTFAETCWNR